MTTAFIVVVASALLPQIIFSMLYWKWIPAWIRNPYGRLAQLGSLCHIILLSLYLILVLFGKYFNPYAAEIVLILAFVPLVAYGLLQLLLLRKAVESARSRDIADRRGVVFYHSTLPQSSNLACGEIPFPGDVVVPYEEVMDGRGRHFNHPACAEALAKLAAGQLRRLESPS